MFGGGREGWGLRKAGREAPPRCRRFHWPRKSQIDVKCAEGRAGSSRRLYLFPRLVNVFVRPFHVATYSKSKAPLSLKQRIFVRRARVPLALNVSPLRPSSPLAVPRRPPPP
ncbi:hypothetical protein FB107DRAFT_278856 [Schizophyllum commune]